MKLDGEVTRRADRELEAAERAYAVPKGLTPHAFWAILRHGNRNRTVILDGRRRTIAVRFEQPAGLPRPLTLTFPIKNDDWEHGCRMLGIL